MATFPSTANVSMIHLLCHMDSKNQSSRDSRMRARTAAMLSSRRERGGLPVILEASKEGAPTLPWIDFVALLEVSAKTHRLLLSCAYLKRHLASWHPHTQAQTHNVRPLLAHQYLHMATSQWLALGSSLSPKMLDLEAAAPHQMGAVFNFHFTSPERQGAVCSQTKPNEHTDI